MKISNKKITLQQSAISKMKYFSLILNHLQLLLQSKAYQWLRINQ